MARQREGGFTIVETLVASLLTVAMLAMITAGVRSVHVATRENDALVREQTARRSIAQVLRTELETTSVNNGRFRIEDAGRTIRFSRLIGAERSGAEVSGRWSSNVVIALRNGNVVREQDGATALLATGVRDLNFAYPGGANYIEVTVRALRRGATGGDQVESTRTFRIYPKN